MQIAASVPFITALHEVLSRPAPQLAPPTPSVARITKRALTDGWVTPFEIETVITETDPRLWRLSVRDLLRTFDIPVQHVFERPSPKARDAEGTERVSALDLARFLIALERAGLAIDPAPICQSLARTLATKRLLTAGEMTVYWRAERRSDEPLRITSPAPNIACGDAFTTPAGFIVRSFHEGEDGGAVCMMVIEPPTARTKAPARQGAADRRRPRSRACPLQATRLPAHRPQPSPAA